MRLYCWKWVISAPGVNMLFEFSLAQLAAVLDVPAPAGAAALICSGVCTDTRKIQPGDLYVALKGEHFNGNEFAVDALAAGAVAALLDEEPPVGLEDRCLQVADALLALGQLSGWQREAFTGPVVAITGSAGKTSTKQLMAGVLAQQFNCWMTQGNLNNHIGAPLTLLALQPEHQAAVIELGASGRGEIGYTAQWVRPKVGIITNAAGAHLEGFGSLQTVVETKGELIDYVDADGCVVLNADDPAFELWCQRAGSRRIVSFGLDHPAAVTARDLRCGLESSHFLLCLDGAEYPVLLPLPGRHNVRNALAVVAAANALGMTIETIVAGLANASAVKGRLQRLPGIKGLTIIDDSYNANPASLQAAIDVISLAPNSWLVMGDMAELGADAAQAHGDAGRYARQQGVSVLVATGPLSRFATEAFGAGSFWFENKKVLAEYIQQHAPEQTLVLVKGSRSAGMDDVVRALQLDSGE
jgi:UDP-N-acetylmuramoyl-tripeptide--D-alanyl-D-alanine ligase